MKVVTPEISWHGRDPVYGADFQFLGGDIRRLATCGTDRHVRLWEVKAGKEGKPTVEFLSSLTRHSRTVNCVRFSPNGRVLASAGDDCVILLWKLNETHAPVSTLFAEEEQDNKETWSVFKSLRSHLEDVSDICWSQDSKCLISGSVDNSAILWDVKKGQRIAIFPEHKSIVQGVAFDPLHHFVATLCSDRCCRIYNIQSKNCVHNISKLTLPGTGSPSGGGDTEEKVKPRSFRMFHDDTMRSFFRRLAFSPDGQLLVAPSGCIERNGEDLLNTTFIFARNSFSKPIMHLPVPSKFTIVVRFSPLLYELRKIPRMDSSEDKENINANESEEWKKYHTMFKLPYRMIFAVGTEDSILLYDTQQPQPFAYITNIHYHQLSDITWAHDGRFLVVSSTDGYCTLVQFNSSELGVPLPPEKQMLKVTQKGDVEPEEPVKSKKGASKAKTAGKDSAKEGEKTSAPGTAENSSNSSSLQSNAGQPPATKSSEETQTPTAKEPKRVQVTTLTASASATSDKDKESSVGDKDASKNARRVQVTTLSSTPTSQDKSTENKTARRVQVTTLVSTPTSSAAATSNGDSVTPQKNETTAGTSTPTSHSAQKKTPRRVQVTTLSQTPTKSEDADEKATPVKSDAPKAKPRRVQVTTLSAASNTEPAGQEEKLPSFGKKIGAGSSSSLADPIIIDSDSEDRSLHLQLETTSDVPESSQSASSKTSRRVNVTTLQTFPTANKD